MNDKSDIYNFAVFILEAITRRDPVDYGRSTNEVFASCKNCLLDAFCLFVIPSSGKT